MPKPRSILVLFTVYLLFVPWTSAASAAVQGTAFPDLASHHRLAPDMLILEAPVKDREMPGVIFAHGLHANAMEGDCKACHILRDNKPVFSFKDTRDLALEKRQDAFHDACLACHREMADKPPPMTRAGTGPMEAQCRACHTLTSPLPSDRASMPFNRLLHFRHEISPAIAVKDSKTNCQACHHSANEKTLETFYEKGQEGACLYCHTPEGRDKIRSARKAAHDSCVACHLTQTQRDLSAGPVDCKGCHDAKRQMAYGDDAEEAKPIPRLKRNQPDSVLMTGWPTLGQDTDRNSAAIRSAMDPVPFDHKFHEGAGISCKTCHHAALKDCKSCHTVEGSQPGGFVKLADAMHNARADQSCIGCHSTRLAEKDCAGCHAQLVQAATPRDNSCKACHSVDAQGQPQWVLKKGKDSAALARTAIERRNRSHAPLGNKKIPELVVIDALAKEYKPSRFPHKKVVDSLMETANKSKLARAFHGSDLTLCSGCHHNSPPSLTPPKCASCHGSQPDLSTGKPGLKGAYHGQCITCHQKMEVTSVPARDCVKCHEKK